MTQPSASKLLQLPLELHGCVSIFLPPGSIASLTKVNFQLRLIYEKTLYRRINLYGQPGRTVRLLRTFAFRPDLALLVHSLKVNFSWLKLTVSGGRWGISPNDLSRLNALGLARNIKSFSLQGVYWLLYRAMAPIREIISKMKLTSLQTFVSTPFSHRRGGQSEAETIFGNLRMTLQGQPMLRDLNFEYPECPGNVRNGIEISDIPSLQTLQADPLTVARILPVAARDQLKSVEVLGWTKIWTGFLVSSFSRLTEARQKVRKLELWMEWDLERGWDFDFGQVLEMFPNTDSLRIKGLSSEPDKDDIELMDAFLEKVASQITQSLKLTTIEVSLRITNMWRSDCVNDVTEELKLRLKSSCPSLKTFIDPARQEWAFLSCEEEERSNDFRVVNLGRVCRGFKYSSDLEALEGGSVDLISD